MTSNTPFYQKLILWGTLVVTVVAALLMEDETEFPVEEVVQPSLHSADSKHIHEQACEILPIDQLGKRQFSARADDIFAMMSWQPKRNLSTGGDEPVFLPRQEIVRQPPPPSAPPLQFEYLGKVISQGRVRVFLAGEDQNYVAGTGEKVNAEYRIDHIRKDAIELTYLPLGIRQILTIE